MKNIIQFIRRTYRRHWDFPNNWKPFGYTKREMDADYWYGKKLKQK